MMGNQWQDSVQIKPITKNSNAEHTAKELFEVANSGIEAGSPWSEQQFFESLDSGVSLIVGAFLEKELLGFLVAGQMKFETEIYFIVVKDEFKNQAVGERLLDDLVRHAQAANHEAILLEVRKSNKPARRLYEKLNFEEVGVRKAYYSSPIEDAILMKRVL